MADVQDQQQQIINAQQAVQLAVLPPFSNKPTEDRFTATQWLQKVILHKAGATWTDRQAITHFRNALRGNVINWFDTLADLESTPMCGTTFKEVLKLTTMLNQQLPQ